MKRALFLTSSLASLLMSGPAIAQEVCGASYIVLPDGNCLNLSYMSVLEDTRSNLEQIEELYQEQFENNVILESSYLYRLTESEEDRNERYQSLAETSIVRDEVAASAAEIEATLFPLHTRTISIVSEAFAPFRFSENF